MDLCDSPDTVADDRLRAVVCDDDAVVRSVVGDLIEERGGEVIADTERSADAIVLADRFTPNAVVLDLGLGVGSGMDVLHHFAGRGDAPAIVVFTAFDGIVDHPAVSKVIRKPEFGQLGRALDGITQLRVQRSDRRRSTRPLPTPVDRDAVGIDDTAAFYQLLVEAQPDDALIAVSTEGLDPMDAALAVRRVLRTDDRLTQRRGWLVALLVGGGAVGPGAVAQRLTGEIPDVGERFRAAAAGDAPAEAFVDLTG